MGDTTESSSAVASDTPAVVTSAPVVVDDIYYVNNNEITGNSIVGEILTGRENFVKWRKAMRIALSARLKLGFVDGEHPKPKDPQLRARWQRCNDVIMSWLLCSVSKEVTGQILDANDVADAWTCLHMMYAGSNLSRKFALQQEIANLMQGTMTVAKYFEVLSGLWRELDAMKERRGCSVTDDCIRCQENARENQENKVMKFLMGLNESLAHIRTHILALERLPKLNVVFDMVSNHESEKNLTKMVAVETSAMFVNHQQVPRQSYTNQQKGQQQFSQNFSSAPRTYENTAGRVKQRPYCSYCQQPGHTKETCFKLNGYPPGHRLYKGKGNTNRIANNVMTISDDNGTNKNNSNNEASGPPQLTSTNTPFGGLSTTAAVTPGVGNPFVMSSAPGAKTTSSGFSFGASSTIDATSAGATFPSGTSSSPTGATSSAFLFGASSTSTPGTSTIGFTSGSSSAHPVSTTSSPFTFGSSSSSGSSFGASSTPALFSFGASSTPAATNNGSPFGFTSGSCAFPFNTGTANNTPAAQPLFGNSNPFGSVNDNNQTSMEDSMAEDSVQATSPAFPVFGQPSANASSFGFTAPTPSGSSNSFQFGSQQNLSNNPSPFRSLGGFNAGGSFSLGTGGDKSNRRIIKPKKGRR